MELENQKQSAKVLISILNWNNAADTLACVSSLAPEISGSVVQAEVRVIDNGSRQDEYAKLLAGAEKEGVTITRLEHNLGFTGGHNTSIKLAIEHGFDYIWLLNNDATVAPGCLLHLVNAMEQDEGMGAASPVIAPEGGGKPFAAWGGVHEWKTRSTVWFESEEESRKAHVERPDDVFVAGTAILMRTAALCEVGGLDDRLFAYYDDSDMGVRLAKAGWRSKVVFDATIEHTHMPAEHRRALGFKLVNQAIYNAIRLPMRGMHSQAKASLLGIWDFMLHRYGKPDLDRKVPALMSLACSISKLMHKSRLSEYRKTLVSSSASSTAA
jgi:GT2 family glycosyltransferase